MTANKQKQIQALVDMGVNADLAARLILGDEVPVASEPVAEASTASAKPKFVKAGCAYGVKRCGTFLPNGVGSAQHRSCKGGRDAMRAAKAARA